MYTHTYVYIERVEGERGKDHLTAQPAQLTPHQLRERAQQRAGHPTDPTHFTTLQYVEELAH